MASFCFSTIGGCWPDIGCCRMRLLIANQLSDCVRYMLLDPFLYLGSQTFSGERDCRCFSPMGPTLSSIAVLSSPNMSSMVIFRDDVVDELSAG
jgi:hypothetical protein